MKFNLIKINKFFGEKQVLRDINIKLDGNRVVGLLGPNGAGKTTLMRIICGFYGTSEGAILINNRKVNSKDKKYKQMIGYLPENNPLYGYKLKGLTNSEISRQIRKWSVECGIGEYLDQKIEILSKGYRQRVGLAASLMGNPKILILDEPTSGLDPKQIIEVRKLIKKLAKEKLVLLSTHILPEARAICDRLLIISRGSIVLDKETTKIRSLEKKFIDLTS
ncbi:MAG: Gliding motility-associated ABC transporter ATP-binding subunit GldA [Candidatus Shapirobacteria bacterium GW2011_GWE1_38_92]|uniref:Gliding motility-associated ABC transporter ATP-binding subunit GldA n=1 Tax=Candidatus Shapirobacteria bacterium GW2011_GWE1_38_92 TaxID=1618489 RepID=A0A0G0LHB8_9BACT|nr:MAG: Gliding motility-associated ABC transporter ATP-binding subunit GldA [Candidatus Shapirobacteria bacterium GW2011_GWE1_38_92]